MLESSSVVQQPAENWQQNEDAALTANVTELTTYINKQAALTQMPPR